MISAFSDAGNSMIVAVPGGVATSKRTRPSVRSQRLCSRPLTDVWDASAQSSEPPGRGRMRIASNPGRLASRPATLPNSQSHADPSA